MKWTVVKLFYLKLKHYKFYIEAMSCVHQSLLSNPMSQEKWALKPMTPPQFLGAKETHKDASLWLLASWQVTVDA